MMVAHSVCCCDLRVRVLFFCFKDDPAKEEMEKNEKEAVETARKV